MLLGRNKIVREGEGQHQVMRMLYNTILFVLLTKTLLTSPISNLSKTAPQSRTGKSDGLSNTCILLLGDRRSPFSRRTTYRTFNHFFDRHRTNLTPLTKRAIVLCVPGSSTTLSTCDRSLIQQTTDYRIALTIQPLRTIFLHSHLQTQLCRTVLMPTTSLPSNLRSRTHICRCGDCILH